MKHLLYNNRSQESQDFIKEVCGYILDQPLKQKVHSNEYCGIFVEGRDREVNCLEDCAAIHSFKAFSKQDYPVFMFLYNTENLLNKDKKWLKENGIIVVKLADKITSLEEYTNFCMNFYFSLPADVEKVITLQPDGMLLKSGWENYIESTEADWLSPHWRHVAAVEAFNNENEWSVPEGSKGVQIGNGGFSFRKKSRMQRISSLFRHFKMREFGRPDDRIPMEDLFYSFWGSNTGMMKMPTLEQCRGFAQDPLTPKIFKEKSCYGFHFFKQAEDPDWPDQV